MDSKYSLKKQISNDYLTLTTLIGTIVFLIFLIGIFGFGIALTKRNGIIILDNKEKLIFGIIFSVFSILCFIFFILRIKTCKYLVNNGLEIDAKIIDVYYYKDRGRIEYIYNIDNKEFKRGAGIHITKDTKDYKKDDIIKLLIDPKNNKKNIIKNNFINNQ
jgi:hypothetical protein